MTQHKLACLQPGQPELHLSKPNRHVTVKHSYVCSTLASINSPKDIYTQACVLRHPGPHQRPLQEQGPGSKNQAVTQRVTGPHRQAETSCSSHTPSHTVFNRPSTQPGARVYLHPHAPGGLGGSAHCGTPMGGGGMPGMPCAATCRVSLCRTSCHMSHSRSASRQCPAVCMRRRLCTTVVL